MKVIFEKVIAAARIPVRAHAGDIGYDLAACEACLVPAGGRCLVDTGLKVRVEIPEAMRQLGLVCHPEIKGRSGLAVRGIDVAAGQVDLGYRGSLRVCLVNLGREDFPVQVGDRVAQLKFTVVALPDVVEGPVDAPSDDSRGSSGFGSTGL